MKVIKFLILQYNHILIFMSVLQEKLNMENLSIMMEFLLNMLLYLVMNGKFQMERNKVKANLLLKEMYKQLTLMDLATHQE